MKKFLNSVEHDPRRQPRRAGGGACRPRFARRRPAIRQAGCIKARKSRAALGRRLRPRAAACRVRGPRHAGCGLSRPGVHRAHARPDGGGGGGDRQRRRRAVHRQELRRRRDELRHGARDVRRPGRDRADRRRRGGGDLHLFRRAARRRRHAGGGENRRRRRRAGPRPAGARGAGRAGEPGDAVDGGGADQLHRPRRRPPDVCHRRGRDRDRRRHPRRAGTAARKTAAGGRTRRRDDRGDHSPTSAPRHRGTCCCWSTASAPRR